MLVLSRQKDERIFIGDNITIAVLEIRGDKVRLGIDAPKEVSVHREEVYRAIQNEKLAGLAGADCVEEVALRQINELKGTPHASDH